MFPVIKRVLLTGKRKCRSPEGFGSGKRNGDNRTRTCDPLRVMQVLSQLSYASVNYLTTFPKKCKYF